jgi:hypothetical protein
MCIVNMEKRFKGLSIFRASSRFPDDETGMACPASSSGESRTQRRTADATKSPL